MQLSIKQVLKVRSYYSGACSEISPSGWDLMGAMPCHDWGCVALPSSACSAPWPAGAWTSCCGAASDAPYVSPRSAAAVPCLVPSPRPRHDPTLERPAWREGGHYPSCGRASHGNSRRCRGFLPGGAAVPGIREGWRRCGCGCDPNEACSEWTVGPRGHRHWTPWKRRATIHISEQVIMGIPLGEESLRTHSYLED